MSLPEILPLVKLLQNSGSEGQAFFPFCYPEEAYIMPAFRGIYPAAETGIHVVGGHNILHGKE